MSGDAATPIDIDRQGQDGGKGRPMNNMACSISCTLSIAGRCRPWTLNVSLLYRWGRANQAGGNKADMEKGRGKMLLKSFCTTPMRICSDGILVLFRQPFWRPC